MQSQRVMQLAPRTNKNIRHHPKLWYQLNLTCQLAPYVGINTDRKQIRRSCLIFIGYHSIGLKYPWEQGSWGQHGANLGPTGPRWAPCRPHELCYLGWLIEFMSSIRNARRAEKTKGVALFTTLKTHEHFSPVSDYFFYMCRLLRKAFTCQTLGEKCYDKKLFYNNGIKKCACFQNISKPHMAVLWRQCFFFEKIKTCVNQFCIF